VVDDIGFVLGGGAVNAAGESRSRTLQAEITAAVLSQADSERFETDNAPLLATVGERFVKVLSACRSVRFERESSAK